MMHYYPPSMSVGLILKNLCDHAAQYVATRDGTEVESVPMDQICQCVAEAWKGKPPLDALAKVSVGHRPEIAIAFDIYGNIDTYDYDEKYGAGKTESAIESAVHNGASMFARAAVRACVFLAIFARISIAFCTTETVNGIRWDYSVCKDGVAITNAYISEEIGAIVVPEKLGNVDVVEIGVSACASPSRKNLNKLVLPSRIKRIKERAFYNQILREMEFPETLEVLDIMAFGADYSGAPVSEWEGLPRLSNGNVEQVLFWGHCPQITNTGGVARPDSGGLDGMFWYDKGASYAFVDERWIGEFYEGCGGYYGTNLKFFQGAQLKPGFATVTICRHLSEKLQGEYMVSMECSNSSAKIYYTLDGSMPCRTVTMNCFLYDVPFEVSSALTIRAIADVAPTERWKNAVNVSMSDYQYVKEAVLICKKGYAHAPTIVSSAGVVYDKRNNVIELACDNTDVTIRYTLDGSPVTESSPVYTAPFAISKTTTVRAKAFKEDWFDSEETVQTFTRKWYTNEPPVVSAVSDTFSSTAHEVTLSCEDPDATIYYTIGGGEPNETYGRVYDGPFYIYDTATVKAIAVKDDWKDSEVVSRTFTKVGNLGTAIDFLEIAPDNDKTHPWTVVTDVTHDGISAVKSGDIEDEESTTLKVVVYGAGQLSFWWRTSCEPSIDGEYYDYATFYNGSTEVARLAGVTDWQRVTLDVAGTGKHTFKWTYQKDDSGSMAPDGMWLDQVQWIGATTDYYADHTLTTDTPVPYKWLMGYGFGMATGFETAAKSKTGKRDAFGRELTVEADYIAGTDPTNATSQLRSYIAVTNGVPYVTWEPNHVGEREYKIWGKESLDDAKWQYPTNALHRFFKVTVGLP